MPVSEKIFSIFETHSDMIIKGSRDIQYGHKLNLSSGKSGLILDLVIETGNPADTHRLLPMLDRHIKNGSTRKWCGLILAFLGSGGRNAATIFSLRKILIPIAIGSSL